MNEGKQTSQTNGDAKPAEKQSKQQRPATFAPMNDAALKAVERSASAKERGLIKRLVENVRFQTSRANSLERRVERLEAAGRELRTAEESIDALPPNDVDAELAVLGACLLRPERLIEVRKLLKPEDFYHDDLRLIFEAMIELEDQWSPIDVLLVVAKLKEQGKLEEAGGAYRLSQVIAGCPSAANVGFYCRIVSILSSRRRLQSLGIWLMAGALDLTRKPADLISEAMERLR